MSINKETCRSTPTSVPTHLLDDNLASVEVVAVHLLEGNVDQLLRVELNDATAARLASVVREYLHVGNLAHYRERDTRRSYDVTLHLFKILLTKHLRQTDYEYTKLVIKAKMI